MIKYNLDFQLVKTDVEAISDLACDDYCRRYYRDATRETWSFKRRSALDSAVLKGVETLFRLKFGRELNVGFSRDARTVLIVDAYRLFEKKLENKPAGKNDRYEAERDFVRACKNEIEYIAERMRGIHDATIEDELYDEQPEDRDGSYIEWELAEDVERAWFNADWKEFDLWDDDFDGVASFAVVALSE